MACPAAEKPAKYECDSKSEYNQQCARINNTIFYKGMKKFLKIQTAYELITKKINMGENDDMNPY